MTSRHSELDFKGQQPLVVRTAVHDLPELTALARRIWHSHYPGIISTAQIDYMLERMYSLDRLERELREERVTYFHIGPPGSMSAFAAVGPTDDSRIHKLHKLYVQADHQKKGYGRALLRAVVSTAQGAGARQLTLCVNKRNQIALKAYRAYGFQTRAEACVDIGGGYFMDDFILRLDL